MNILIRNRKVRYVVAFLDGYILYAIFPHLYAVGTSLFSGVSG